MINAQSPKSAGRTQSCPCRSRQDTCDEPRAVCDIVRLLSNRLTSFVSVLAYQAGFFVDRSAVAFIEVDVMSMQRSRLAHVAPRPCAASALQVLLVLEVDVELPTMVVVADPWPRKPSRGQ